ncbi:MAG: type II secretion system protein [Planctomycetota bacterium]
MTSTKASGTFSRPRSGSRAAAASMGGFTLIEVLLVVTILTSLAALVLVGGGRMIEGTQARATKSLITRLELLLERYRSETGYYPPDGIDSPVVDGNGNRLRGSAALYYALTTDKEVEIMTGGIPRVITVEALAIGESRFSDRELSSEDEDFPGVREILDPFGNPVHYDNTFDGRFMPQGGEVHVPPMDDDEDHPEDPRTTSTDEGKWGVVQPGKVQSKKYDLWSWGKWSAEDPDEPPIANWNLNE